MVGITPVLGLTTVTGVDLRDFVAHFSTGIAQRLEDLFTGIVAPGGDLLIDFSSSADRALILRNTGTGTVAFQIEGAIVGLVSLTANTITATTLGGTLATASQPNITTVGTLAGLAVSGSTTLAGPLTVQGDLQTSGSALGGVAPRAVLPAESLAPSTGASLVPIDPGSRTGFELHLPDGAGDVAGYRKMLVVPGNYGGGTITARLYWRVVGSISQLMRLDFVADAFTANQNIGTADPSTVRASATVVSSATDGGLVISPFSWSTGVPAPHALLHIGFVRKRDHSEDISPATMRLLAVVLEFGA